MDLDTAIVNLDQIHEAYAYLKTSPHVVRTPVLPHIQNLFQRSDKEDEVDDLLVKDLSKVDLYLKMENMQTTGSFKIRGVINQMRKVQEKYGKLPKLVTMSAGNYGKAFAHAVGNSGTKSVCVMPKTAPQNRSKLIEKMGVEVRKTPTSELQSEVDRLVAEEDFVFCHPFDDVNLIAGYASSALEVLEDVPDADVVVVCCGGGGLVSGVGAGISLSGHRRCRVYAVEPDGASTMFESFKARRPITLPEAKSVAAGLAPPYAGTICYRHCRWFVEDILLVSDAEILRTMRLLFQRGIKAEPSGCAALAAVLSGKVPDIEGKKVVVYISGGNVTCSELAFYMKEEV
ncbi:L-threonine dehydratase catabolic TdcB-like isoform X2 [Physella acuta]|nr:L-threonine dehydratase catabolic TdcB-like isoform X2 [Physella acuta]XP_059175866.1 L-threonine dehydratase catabolic TdcB-like isoform X2 [Physella acuta]